MDHGRYAPWRACDGRTCNAGPRSELAGDGARLAACSNIFCPSPMRCSENSMKLDAVLAEQV